METTRHLPAVFLTHAHRVSGFSETATGTTAGVLVNVRYILQTALLLNASAIIVAHSHPSGNLRPSARDIRETQKLVKACRLFDITLLDHLIITSESYVSLAIEGEL